MSRKVQPASTVPTTDAISGVVGASTYYARADHVHSAFFVLSGITPLPNAVVGAAGSGGAASQYDHVHPSTGLPVSTQSGSWTTDLTANVYEYTGSSADDCSLISAASVPDGWWYRVKLLNGGGSISFNPSGSQTIDDVSGRGALVLTVAYSAITLIRRADATGWYIYDRYL